MNILLINPPVPNKFKIFDYCDEAGRSAIKKRVLIGPPLALNELAGVVPDENVYIVDQQEEVNMNPEYDYIEDTVRLIKEFEPQVVGITCLTSQFNNVKRLLDVIKKCNSKILCTVGGIHASSAPEDFSDTRADIISIGLGKHSFLHIIKEFKKDGFDADFTHIPGIAINNNGKLKYTKCLGEISYKEFMEEYFLGDIMPNRELTDRYQYLIPDAQKRMHYLCTSMGCTNKCNFCYLWKMTNGKYFHKEVDQIIKEIKTMDNYGVIRFADANTYGDMRRAEELFTRIKEEGLNRNHIFMGDVRADAVVRTPEIIKLSVDAGLRLVVCGLEATSDEELEKYGKGSGVKEIVEGLKILNELGVRVNGNYIVRPDYDERDFDRLRNFIEDNPIHNSTLTILTPFPGTEQWKELKDQIVIDDFDYYNLTNCVLKTKLSEEQFYLQIAETYRTIDKSGKKYKVIYKGGKL